MASDWEKVRLGDHISLRGGLSYKTEFIDKGNALLIGMGCVSHTERFLTKGVRRYSGDFSEAHCVRPGDLVIATRQQSDNLPILGFPAMIPDDFSECDVITATNLYKVINHSDISNRFLYWLMRGTAYRERILSCSKGTTVRMLTKDAIEDFCFLCPPKAVQKAITGVLDSLDDKIDLNRRMNQTLEAMARALFQSWFVDFDPVYAKADGRAPSGLDPATAALFPDSLQDSELGPIPTGWEVLPIENLCNHITSGGTPARMNKAYWEPATIPWFKTGELLDGPLIDAEEKISEEGLSNSSCKLWPAGTILFALYASPTVGRFGVLTKPGTANQAAAALIAKPVYGVPFLMGLLYEARSALQRVAVGAAQQNINQGVLKSHIVVSPPPNLAQAYSEKVASWFEQRISLANQSRTLATLRDTLLPKLLSGEMNIN